MRIIAVINQKGGCGKTTTSINVAACMARLGQRTLLVDLDPQGHCAVGLAVPEEQVERSIYDTLIEPGDGKVCRMQEVVWQIASDFDLAPSNLKLAAFEQLFAGRPGRENRLGLALSQVKDRYKFAILDCPPSVGLITFNALKACDEVVVPVETGFFSLHGLTKMLQTLELMKEKAGKDVAVRILPTLYDTRTKLAREVLSELRARFKGQLMESTVNFNTKLKEAASFGQPITEYDPGSRGYKDFVNLARELMGQAPIETEMAPSESLSRPMELVQRAKALANLTNLQFGRGTATAGATGGGAVRPATSGVGGNGNGSGLGRTGSGAGYGSGLGNGAGVGRGNGQPSRAGEPVIAGALARPAAEAPRAMAEAVGSARQDGFDGGWEKNIRASSTEDRVNVGGVMVPSTPMASGGNGAGGTEFGGAVPAMSGMITMAGSVTAALASELAKSATRLANETGVAVTLAAPVETGMPMSPASMIGAAPTATMMLLPEVSDAGPVVAQVRPAARAKTTEEKLAEFYGVKRMGGEVHFAAKFSEAMRVELAGDFNNWSPGSTPMQTDAGGRWVVSLPLSPGRYRYRLVVDGRWVTDPNNMYVESNQFGELNNVVEVD